MANVCPTAFGLVSGPRSKNDKSPAQYITNGKSIHHNHYKTLNLPTIKVGLTKECIYLDLKLKDLTYLVAECCWDQAHSNATFTLKNLPRKSVIEKLLKNINLTYSINCQYYIEHIFKETVSHEIYQACLLFSKKGNKDRSDAKKFIAQHLIDNSNAVFITKKLLPKEIIVNNTYEFYWIVTDDNKRTYKTELVTIKTGDNDEDYEIFTSSYVNGEFIHSDSIKFPDLEFKGLDVQKVPSYYIRKIIQLLIIAAIISIYIVVVIIYSRFIKKNDEDEY